MDFDLPPETLAWRDELRAFLRDTLPPGFEGDDDFFDNEDQLAFAREFSRKLGARGWLAPAWPIEYGGMGRTAIEQFILHEELAYHRAPAAGRLFTLGIAGPAILAHGTEDQKRRLLPRMAAGELWFCQGFSERDAGSDLASLQTRAVLDGDSYVITGHKIWTSNAHAADVMLLLARTGPPGSRHRGISAFVVDMATPGITVRGIDNLAYRHDFNEVFLDGVRVPADNLLGGVDNGWAVATTTLDFERANIAAISGARRTLDDLIAWAQEDQAGGRPWDRPTVRSTLMQLEVDVQVGRLLAFRTAWLQSRGAVPNYEASVGKVWMAELGIRVTDAGLNLLGMHGLLTAGSRHARLHGRLATASLLALSGPIAGGGSEIQRDIIARRGLGLPRS